MSLTKNFQSYDSDYVISEFSCLVINTRIVTSSFNKTTKMAVAVEAEEIIAVSLDVSHNEFKNSNALGAI